MSEVRKIVKVWWPMYDNDSDCWTVKFSLCNGRVITKTFKKFNNAYSSYQLFKDLKEKSR